MSTEHPIATEVTPASESEEVPKLGAKWKMAFYLASAQITYCQGILVTMGSKRFADLTLEEWTGFGLGFLGASVLAIKTYTSKSWPGPQEGAAE